MCLYIAISREARPWKQIKLESFRKILHQSTPQSASRQVVIEAKDMTSQAIEERFDSKTPKISNSSTLELNSAPQIPFATLSARKKSLRSGPTAKQMLETYYRIIPTQFGPNDI